MSFLPHLKSIPLGGFPDGTADVSDILGSMPYSDLSKYYVARATGKLNEKFKVYTKPLAVDLGKILSSA